jgi:hypothetical protein
MRLSFISDFPVFLDLSWSTVSALQVIVKTFNIEILRHFNSDISVQKDDVLKFDALTLDLRFLILQKLPNSLTATMDSLWTSPFPILYQYSVYSV